MSADPHALSRDVSQQCVETSAISTVLNGVDPDQHAVNREQLFTNVLGEAFIIDRRLGFNADGGECFEDVYEAAFLRRRIPPRGSVSA